MSLRFKHTNVLIVCLLAVVVTARPAISQESEANAAIRKSEEQLLTAFNAAKADAVVDAFAPNGELIDENGVVYKGSQQIKDVLTEFFKQFPGAKLSMDIESIRLAGSVGIEEGTRTMTTADGAEKARFRYIAVWAKDERGWKLASFRDFADDAAPTPNDHLQSIAWLVGDWINEGADGKVAISYQWSEDKNFLLGEFQMAMPGGKARKSTQRIGWDPSANRIRSWLFDADGGFAEGFWTVVEDGIVVKSSSVNPDGTTASATLNITTKDKSHFTIAGTDRIVGDNLDEDFEITVTRRPPTAGK